MKVSENCRSESEAWCSFGKGDVKLIVIYKEVIHFPEIMHETNMGKGVWK